MCDSRPLRGRVQGFAPTCHRPSADLHALQSKCTEPWQCTVTPACSTKNTLNNASSEVLSNPNRHRLDFKPDSSGAFMCKTCLPVQSLIATAYIYFLVLSSSFGRPFAVDVVSVGLPCGPHPQICVLLQVGYLRSHRNAETVQ